MITIWSHTPTEIRLKNKPNPKVFLFIKVGNFLIEIRQDVTK